MARSDALIAIAALLGGCDLVVGIDTDAEPCELGSFAGGTPTDIVEAEEFSIDWDLTFGVVTHGGLPYELTLGSKALTPIDLGPPYMNIGLALTPEGNALFYTAVVEPMQLKGALRGGETQWALDAGVPRGTFAGTPSADVFGPRRVLVRLRDSTDELLEYEDVSGRWTPVGEPHAVATARAPNLTPDGLTMVYAGTDADGNPGVFAAQRRSTAVWFDDAVMIRPGAYSSVQLLGRCRQLFAIDDAMLRRHDR